MNKNESAGGMKLFGGFVLGIVAIGSLVAIFSPMVIPEDKVACGYLALIATVLGGLLFSAGIRQIIAAAHDPAPEGNEVTSYRSTQMAGWGNHQEQ